MAIKKDISVLTPYNPLDKRHLGEVNHDGQYLCPIYVGKAVPEGARKGGQGDDADPGQALYKRLRKSSWIPKSESTLKTLCYDCKEIKVPHYERPSQ